MATHKMHLIAAIDTKNLDDDVKVVGICAI